MIYTLGESLVDIIVENGDFAQLKAGGAMLNTAVSLSRSGLSVKLISEVGDDKTAAFILEFLERNSVGTQHIKKYYHQNTSIAVAWLDTQKKASFSIHKSYPKHRRLISPDTFNEEDILIFGSLYSLESEIRNQLLPILIQAKNAGATLIYDPNIRRHKIDTDELKKALHENLALATIVKASDEDMINVFGTEDPEICFSEIRKANNGAIFIMTKGAEGASIHYVDTVFSQPAHETSVKSTIGAGDAFSAGLAFYLSKKNKAEDYSISELKEMLNTGMAFSAEVCGTMDNYVRPGFRP